MREFFDSSMVIPAETVTIFISYNLKDTHDDLFDLYAYIVDGTALWILLSICHAEVS